MSNVYNENGYDSREDYLMQVAGEYGVDFYCVEAIAGQLGETEDFDGLINVLEDMQDGF